TLSRRMNVQVRLRRVSRVPDFPQNLTRSDALTRIYRNAPLHQVTQKNSRPLELDFDIVARRMCRITLGWNSVRLLLFNSDDDTFARTPHLSSVYRVLLECYGMNPHRTDSEVTELQNIERVSLNLMTKVMIDDFRAATLPHNVGSVAKWKRQFQGRFARD